MRRRRRKRNGWINDAAEATGSLPKDRKWRVDDYDALDFFLRKHYSLKRIARELNRTVEDLKFRLILLPVYLPMIEAARDHYVLSRLTRAAGRQLATYHAGRRLA